jgi:hypothetical protein
MSFTTKHDASEPSWPLRAGYPATTFSEAQSEDLDTPVIALDALASPERLALSQLPKDPFDVARTKRRVALSPSVATDLLASQNATGNAPYPVATEELDAACILEVNTLVRSMPPEVSQLQAPLSPSVTMPLAVMDLDAASALVTASSTDAVSVAEASAAWLPVSEVLQSQTRAGGAIEPESGSDQPRQDTLRVTMGATGRSPAPVLPAAYSDRPAPVVSFSPVACSPYAAGRVDPLRSTFHIPSRASDRKPVARHAIVFFVGAVCVLVAVSAWSILRATDAGSSLMRPRSTPSSRAQAHVQRMADAHASTDEIHTKKGVSVSSLPVRWIGNQGRRRQK